MKLVLTLFAAALALPCLAGAAEPVHEFECDTPAGHFSYWSRTVSSKKVTITGTLKINEKREHEQWNAVASALLIAKNSQGSVGLQIYSIKAQKEFLFLGITKPGSEDEPPFAMIPGDTTTIPFSLTLAKDGTLTVKAADKSASARIEGFTPGKLQLSCSTGDFLFGDVSIE